MAAAAAVAGIVQLGLLSGVAFAAAAPTVAARSPHFQSRRRVVVAQVFSAVAWSKVGAAAAPVVRRAPVQALPRTGNRDSKAGRRGARNFLVLVDSVVLVADFRPEMRGGNCFRHLTTCSCYEVLYNFRIL